jgi:hypothetical protein
MYVREYVASELTRTAQKSSGAHRSLGQAACQLRDDVTAGEGPYPPCRPFHFLPYLAVRSRTVLEWSVRTCRFSEFGLWIGMSL